jgi:hypothetical protein
MDPVEREYYHKQIVEAKNKFYDNNIKKTVFKNKQKLECTQKVSQDFDIKKMMECTVFIVPNKNVIYYNYLIFKLYGNEANQPILYRYFKGLVETLLAQYETFEVHVNLKTFSISACRRYYSMITSSFDDNTLFTEKLSRLVIYNTPSIIDQITTILYATVKDVVPKTVYYYKESEAKIDELFDIRQQQQQNTTK